MTTKMFCLNCDNTFQMDQKEDFCPECFSDDIEELSYEYDFDNNDGHYEGDFSSSVYDNYDYED